MGYEKRDKLNQILRQLPEGHLADTAWLGRMGCRSSLRARYVQGGWLERVGRGVFRRPPHGGAGEAAEAPDWRRVVVSLQAVMEYPVWVGGRTALELHGFAHYISSAGPGKVHLYCGAPPPGWLRKLRLQSPFVFHNAGRLFPSDNGLAQFEIKESPWPLELSAPERAVLEMLDEAPKRETFHHADKLMEGMFNLRPKQLSTLLRECKSVKVKRLFLWFAERHNHAWLKRLDTDSVDIGAGKRVLAPGGRLDPKYLITVPEDLDAGV